MAVENTNTQTDSKPAGGTPNAAPDATKTDVKPAGDGAGAGATMSLDDAIAALKTTRKEAAEHRVKSKQHEETINGLKKLLNLDADASPDAITERLNTLEKQLHAEKIENVFNRVAHAEGVDASLTFLMLKGKGVFDSIEVNGDLEKELSKLVKIAVKEKPALKSVPSIEKNGSSFDGGNAKPKTMNELIRGLARKNVAAGG